MFAGIRAKYHVKNKNYQALQTLVEGGISAHPHHVRLPLSPSRLLLNKPLSSLASSRPLSAFFNPVLKSPPSKSPSLASGSPLFHSPILPLQPLRQPQTPSTERPPPSPGPTSQAAPGSASESATGAIFPPKRGPGAWGSGRAAGRAHSPAAASQGPRRGAAAAGAWCRLARRLTSCAPSPASRASPLRGAGLRTPGTPRGTSLPESQRSAALRGAGRVGGRGRGRAGGRCFWGPGAPLLGGGRKRRVRGARAPVCCAGFQRRQRIWPPQVGASAGGARGQEAAAPALWCQILARGCSRDPAPLSALGSPARPGATSAPA